MVLHDIIAGLDASVEDLSVLHNVIADIDASIEEVRDEQLNLEKNKVKKFLIKKKIYIYIYIA